MTRSWCSGQMVTSQAKLHQVSIDSSLLTCEVRAPSTIFRDLPRLSSRFSTVSWMLSDTFPARQVESGRVCCTECSNTRVLKQLLCTNQYLWVPVLLIEKYLWVPVLLIELPVPVQWYALNTAVVLYCSR